jgi:PAS domain-containing protein
MTTPREFLGPLNYESALMTMTSPHGKFRNAAAISAAQLGFPTYEIVGDSLGLLIEISAQRLKELSDECFRTSGPVLVGLRGRNQHGEFESCLVETTVSYRSISQEMLAISLRVIATTPEQREVRGAPRELLTVQNEISTREAVDDARIEGESLFRTLADNMPQLAWMADSNGWIFWYNRRWYEFTGTRYQEMVGWGWDKVHHPIYFSSLTDISVKAPSRCH